MVIGVGVKNSTSDLLTSNCDEFIYYDDLILEAEKQGKEKRRRTAEAQPRKGSSSDEEEKQLAGLTLVLETIEDLLKERGEEEKVWGSMVKQTLKRRKPGFSESYHGYRTFTKLLEDAQKRGMLDLEYDKKSGGYIIKSLLQDK